MSTPSSQYYDQLDQVAEEFAERFRRGERPSLAEYAARYPELAADLRELIPALVEIERIEPATPPGAAPTPATALPNRIGDYSILREIGRGGMGVVYEAVQASLGRHVALKVIPLAAGRDGKAVERFKREARAAAKLHHTNIVPVFEVGETAEVCFYAMQFIAGQGLDQVIAELERLRAHSTHRSARTRGDPLTREVPARGLARSLLTGRFTIADGAATVAPQHLPTAEPRVAAGAAPTEQIGDTSVVLPGRTELSAMESDYGHYFDSVACIGEQTAAALAHAHERGIVHRDIKPSNLLLDSAGTVWITDFGLAKTDEGDLTNPGDILGTLRYMSPERFQGQSDARADIYALGLTLYELLVLRPAFSGGDRATLIAAISSPDPPTAPRSLDARIPRDLETIVLKAIAKEPARRYQRAADLAEDLRRFRAREPITARRTSMLERTRLWCRRNKALAALYAVLIVAAVGSSAGALYLHQLLNESERQRLRVTEAEQAGKAELWKSYLAQARATRMTRQAGQRFGALRAIQAALEVPVPEGRSRDELRTEAIAALCLADIEVLKEWDGYPTGSTSFAIDTTFERYAVADQRGNVVIRKISDDAELMRIAVAGPCADYDGLRFSPDGRFLRVSTRGAMFQALWQLDVHPPVRKAIFLRMEFSADGKRLAAVFPENSVRILEAESLRELWRFTPMLPIGDLHWNPTRPHQLIVSNGHAIQITNVDGGEVGPLVSMPGNALRPTWHPEGHIIAFSSGNHTIHFWNTQRRAWHQPPLVGHKTGGVLHAFDHAGDLLVSTDWTGTWRLWDVPTGRQLLTLPADGHTLQFSPDNERLAAHTGSGKVRLFRVAAGKEARTFGGPPHHAYHDHGTAPLHPGGRLLAVRVARGTMLMDVEREEELAVLPGALSPVSFTAAGALLTTGPAGLLSWPIRPDGANQTQLRVGPPEPVAQLPAQIAAFSADGSVAAGAHHSQGAIIWHEAGQRTLATAGPQDDVRFCAVSPDGRWVATGSGELLGGAGTKVWDARTGRLVAELPTGRMSYVAFSPDNQWLCTTGSGERLWHVGSWQAGPILGSSAAGQVCAFTRDGRWLALAGQPGMVRIVETATGRPVALLTTGVESIVWPKAFSADGGKLIAVGRGSQTLHIFDLARIWAGLARLDLAWEDGPGRDLPIARAPPPPLAVDVDMGYMETDATRLFQKAVAHQNAQEYTQAIAMLRRTVQANAFHGSAHNNLAWLLLTGPEAVRDPKAGLAHAQQACRLAPAQPTFTNTLGVALVRNAKYAEAVPVLEASLAKSKVPAELEPTNLYFLAVCHLHLGDTGKARACLERADRWLEQRRGQLTDAVRSELTVFQEEARRALKAQPPTK